MLENKNTMGTGGTPPGGTIPPTTDEKDPKAPGGNTIPPEVKDPKAPDGKSTPAEGEKKPPETKDGKDSKAPNETPKQDGKGKGETTPATPDGKDPKTPEPKEETPKADEPKKELTAEEKAEAEKQAMLDGVIPLDITQIKDGEQVKMLPTTEFQAFKGHPFVSREDSKYLETLASIKKGGVHTPIIARPLEKGGFEIISGHRRVEACKELGIKDIPVFVRKLSDEEAAVIMFDTNINREKQLPSERARGIEIQLNAMGRLKGRPTKDGETRPAELKNMRSADVLAKQMGISKTSIYRHLSLLKLIPALVEKVDTDKLRLDIAEHVAALKKDEQKMMFEIMDADIVSPSMAQATRCRELSNAGQLNKKSMRDVMIVEKPLEFKVTLVGDKIKSFFPEAETPKEIEDEIMKALEFHQKFKDKVKALSAPPAPPKKPNLHGKGDKPKANKGAR